MLFTSSSSRVSEKIALQSLMCSDNPSLTPTIDPATEGWKKILKTLDEFKDDLFKTREVNDLV